MPLGSGNVLGDIVDYSANFMMLVERGAKNPFSERLFLGLFYKEEGGWGCSMALVVNTF